MSDFHKEAKHQALALLFDSAKIEDKYKRHGSDIPYVVVKDKEEKRIFSMVQSSADLGHALNHRLEDGIHCVFFANSIEEEVIIRSGLTQYKPQGAALCTGCLAKAILTCEEQLEVLKDIHKMALEYASKL